jgi:hypothetical protein
VTQGLGFIQLEMELVCERVTLGFDTNPGLEPTAFYFPIKLT